MFMTIPVLLFGWGFICFARKMARLNFRLLSNYLLFIIYVYYLLFIIVYLLIIYYSVSPARKNPQIEMYCFPGKKCQVGKYSNPI